MNFLKAKGKDLLEQLMFIERIGWPPSCVGGMYQPERPVSDCFEKKETLTKNQSK